MDSITATREGNNRQANSLYEQRLATPFLYAIVMHSVLILLIACFWQQDSNQRLAEHKTPIKHSAIKSYLITSQQYQSMLNENNPEPISQPQMVAQPIQAKSDAHKPLLKVNNEATQIAPVVVSNTANSSAPNKPNKTSTPATPAAEVSTHTFNAAISMKQATSQYLQQQNQFEFEQLVGKQTAAQHQPRGSLSEMDATLDFIELAPSPTDTSQPHTLNHKLDPNRIVKQGDYCYRVVNLATQVNPHGWGLGFAEFCGEDKQKQQLTEAINNRVNKVKNTD